MKVQFLVSENDGSNMEWRDLYLDENCIVGFSIPDRVDDLGASLNVYADGGVFTLKQESHLLAYLEERFVKNSLIAE